MNEEDLGFTYRIRKSREVEVLHHGKLAATLRGSDAADFKHGNERLAASHPRNRR
jgi:hypothetical protein